MPDHHDRHNHEDEHPREDFINGLKLLGGGSKEDLDLF
jgi:hypothetical protein